MLRWLLIRPGSTDFDEQGRIQGTLDIPLSPGGNAEVDALIEELREQSIDAIYSSRTEPALSTATILGRSLDVKVKELTKMENLDLGLWQGKLVDEVKRKQPKVYRQLQEQPDCVCPPEGETVADAAARVQDCITRLRKKHSEGVIAIVLPAPLANVFRRCLVNCQLGDLWHASDDHGQWETFDLTTQGSPTAAVVVNGAANGSARRAAQVN